MNKLQVKKTLRLTARISLPLGFAGMLVGMAAAPALASSSLSVTQGGSSVSGQTSSSSSGITASGSDSAPDATGLSAKRTLTLTVTPPGGSAANLAAPKSVASNQAGSISGTFDPTCPSWSSSPCTQAANGDYVFKFSNGSSTQSSTVTLAVPPSAVTGFSGSASGTVATFVWSANSDNVPDFAGYDISGGGSDVHVGVDACDSGGCGVSIDYGAGAQGSTDTFTIRALRTKSPGSSGTVASDPAATSVNFPAPPSSTASGSGSGSGSTDGGATGSSSGGSGSTSSGSAGGNTSGDGGSAGTAGSGGATSSGGQTHGTVINARHPSASLNSFLPSARAGAAPDLPSVLTEIQPLPQGTYKPTLAYPDQTLTSSVQKQDHRAIGRVGTELVHVFDMTALWRSLAIAAIVILVASHLRAWVNHVDIGD
jgi:hypothetical protein